MAATLNGGCSLFGYEERSVSNASADAGIEEDGGLSREASDASLDAAAEASSDAAPDGSAPDGSASDSSALDASAAPRDAETEGGPRDAALDASRDASADAATDGATALCDGGVCPPRCNLSGTFALKLTAPSTWPTSGQISSGTGTFVFRLKLSATHVDNKVVLQLRECGQKVPAIHASLANEDHLLTYPDTLYDTEVLPSVSATMTLGDSTASSSLSLPLVALQMGVKLNDPVNDAWPSSAANLPAAQRVDAEGDGNPAVTGIYASSSGYMYPRTSTSLIPQRAQQAYIAVRWIFSMNGVLSSCDGSQGSATLAKLDSRILGCRHADGTVCSTAEANHLDTNLPKFQFSAASYVLTRVADNATCPTVRTLP